MLPRIVRTVAVVVSMLAPASVAFAQAPPSARRPEWRVTFGPVPAPAAPAAAKRRRGAPLGENVQLNVHAGMGFHSTGSLIDDVCTHVGEIYALEGFTDVNCGGSNGGKPFTLGAFLSWQKPSDGLRLNVIGGYSFTGTNAITLDSSAAYGQFNASFELTGRTAYTSHSFYGGAGVGFQRFTAIGRVGWLRYSGEASVTQRFLFGGQVLDEFDEDEPYSGSAPLFGLRFMYTLMTGVNFLFDWEWHDLGDFYDDFDEDVPPVFQMPVRNRIILLSVAFDIMRVF